MLLWLCCLQRNQTKHCTVLEKPCSTWQRQLSRVQQFFLLPPPNQSITGRAALGRTLGVPADAQPWPPAVLCSCMAINSVCATMTFNVAVAAGRGFGRREPFARVSPPGMHARGRCCGPLLGSMARPCGGHGIAHLSWPALCLPLACLLNPLMPTGGRAGGLCSTTCLPRVLRVCAAKRLVHLRESSPSQSYTVILWMTCPASDTRNCYQSAHLTRCWGHDVAESRVGLPGEALGPGPVLSASVSRCWLSVLPSLGWKTFSI